MSPSRTKALIEQLKREQPSLSKDPTFGALEEEVMAGAEGAEGLEGEETHASGEMPMEDMAPDAESLPTKGAKGAEEPVPGVVGDSAASVEEGEPEPAADSTGLFSSFAMGGEGERRTPEEWEEQLNKFAPKKAKPKASAQPPQEVTVKAGDTMWALAEQYLGDGAMWEQIAKANPGIKDPDKIQPGQKLKLPAMVGPEEDEMGPPETEEGEEMWDAPMVPGAPGVRRELFGKKSSR